MFYRYNILKLGIVFGLIAMAGVSVAFGQGVIEIAGESGSNSTATEFDVTPTPSGQLEFYAVPEDGSAFLTVQNVDNNTCFVRMDFSLENGDAAWAEFLLFNDTGAHFVLATSNNFSASNAFSDQFLLVGAGWIPQDAIYIVDSAGTVYKPKDHNGLVDVIEGIKHNGNTITTFIIKGHGSSDPPLIQVGPDAILICIGGRIFISPISGGADIDITDLLKEVCDGNTVIRLRGCFTKPLADAVESALDCGCDVKGAIRFVIGIPWTCWGIGVYR
jgi:hypothetical protein